MDVQDFHTVAWHEGRTAYNSGIQEDHNPYSWFINNHHQWLEGWRWAQDKDTVPTADAVTGAGGEMG